MPKLGPVAVKQPVFKTVEPASKQNIATVIRFEDISKPFCVVNTVRFNIVINCDELADNSDDYENTVLATDGSRGLALATCV